MNGFEFVRKMLEMFPKDGCGRLLRIAGNQETSWLELKSTCFVSDNDDVVRAAVEADRLRIKKEEQSKLVWTIAKSILAMHNAQGGVILVGVDPSTKHKVCPIEEFSDPKRMLTDNSTKDEGDYLDTVRDLFDQEAFLNGQKRLPIRLDRNVYDVKFAHYKLHRILAILVKPCEAECAIPVLTVPEISYYYRFKNCSKPLPFREFRKTLTEDFHPVSFDRLWNDYRFSYRDASIRWFGVVCPLFFIAFIPAVILTFVFGPSWPCFLRCLWISAVVVFIGTVLLIAIGWYVPNVPMKTRGGGYLWKDVKDSPDGWRIQRHRIYFLHCRLLDPDDNRIAHGMRSLMEREWKQRGLDGERDEQGKVS